MDFRKLKRNGIIIAEALTRYMYNLSDKVIKCMTTQCMSPHTKTVVVLYHFCFISFPQCVIQLYYHPQGFTKRCAGFQGPHGKLLVILLHVQRQVLPSGGSFMGTGERLHCQKPECVCVITSAS